MRVVTPAEMAQIDRVCIEREGIPGLELMERAGECVARAAADMLGATGGRRLAVFCGGGNNGGDGFVAARLLSGWGYRVEVFLLAAESGLNGDARVNFERLGGTGVMVTGGEGPEGGEVPFIEAARDPTSFDLAVDALFGTGFKGRAEGPAAGAIQAINAAGCPVLAVDIPSGVRGDTGAVEGPAVRANRTVTFAALKVGLVQYPGADYAGEVEVADIGIPPRLIESIPESRTFLVDEESARRALPPRKKDAHKGECGRVLVVGGSPGMTGAPALCSRAALRSGAGLVTLAVPEGLHDIFQVKMTEVMTRPLPQTAGRAFSTEAANEVIEMAQGFDAVALGPGMSTLPETSEFARMLVSQLDIPLVIDADGLNSLVGHTDLLRSREAPAVLTPHPGEMARLLGTNAPAVQADRISCARESSSRWGCVVVLKGAGTVVAEPAGTVMINSTGNPGMATAGMGDVLTGCVASLIAQGAGNFDAAFAGAYFHGYAADLAASMDGMVGLTAGDVIRHLPMAMRVTD